MQDYSVKYHVGTSVMQGRRPTQEDRHVVIKDIYTYLEQNQISSSAELKTILQNGMILGLFDGHMGSRASSFCSKELPLEIGKQLATANIFLKQEASTKNEINLPPCDCIKRRKINSTDTKVNTTKSFQDETSSPTYIINCEEIAKLIYRAFEIVDKRFLQKFRLNKDGSTAVLVIILGADVFIAWVGDSRGVLGSQRRAEFNQKVSINFQPTLFQDLKDLDISVSCCTEDILNPEFPLDNCISKDAAWISTPLTIDHKPDRADEEKRIQNAGGLVINTNGVARVIKNQVKVERSTIASYMGFNLIPQPVALAVSRAFGDHELKLHEDLVYPLVISVPEIRHIKINKDLDKVIIIACDGIWDVMSNQQAVSVAEQCQPKTDTFCCTVASQLVKLSYQLGSQDNLTAIVLAVS